MGGPAVVVKLASIRHRFGVPKGVFTHLSCINCASFNLFVHVLYFHSPFIYEIIIYFHVTLIYKCVFLFKHPLIYDLCLFLILHPFHVYLCFLFINICPLRQQEQQLPNICFRSLSGAFQELPRSLAGAAEA